MESLGSSSLASGSRLASASSFCCLGDTSAPAPASGAAVMLAPSFCGKPRGFFVAMVAADAPLSEEGFLAARGKGLDSNREVHPPRTAAVVADRAVSHCRSGNGLTRFPSLVPQSTCACVCARVWSHGPPVVGARNRAHAFFTRVQYAAAAVCHVRGRIGYTREPHVCARRQART